jgi:hypothetical protein
MTEKFVTASDSEAVYLILKAKKSWLGEVIVDLNRTILVKIVGFFCSWAGKCSIFEQKYT